MIRVGTIGFAYDDWAGHFFPPGLPAARRLEYYATQFAAIELDTTFYALPPTGTVERWRSVTPGDFHFALKAPREITHFDGAENLLLPVTLQLWNDFAQLLNQLGAARCTALLQFPPTFAISRLAELERFLTRTSCPSRLAIEFRHASWVHPDAVQLLRSHGIGWVWSDLVPLHEANLPWNESPTGYAPLTPFDTASWRYLRLCGRHGQYENDASEQLDPTPRLRAWLDVMQEVHPGPLPASHGAPESTPPADTLIFCGNSYAGYGIATADRMGNLLGLPPRQALQPSLF